MCHFCRRRRPSRQVVLFVLACIGQILASQSALGIGPDDPRVRRMIDRGKGFLAAQQELRPGGKALGATVFVKDGDSDHPLVQSSLKATLEFTARTKEAIAGESYLYDICMCTIFLCELDAVTYRPQIEKLLDVLWERQIDNGGFSYLKDVLGDTSQTQYVVLAAWTADSHGIPIDWDAIEKTLEWLVRTQTPEGAWGYNPTPANTLGARNKQSDVRMSLVVGALGSIYICADMLGLGSDLKNTNADALALPKAFRPVEEESANEDGKPKKRKGSVSSTLLTHVKKSTIDGNRYFKEHFVVPYGKYDHYYLYGMERYESFRKQIEKGPAEIPTWYEQGVDWLESSMNKKGGWDGDCLFTADTAFSLLFLMRSTEKSIKASLGQGLLTGGRGLPSDTRNIHIRRGKIVAQPLTASPEEIFSIMEDPDSPDFAALVDNPESVLLSADPGKRRGELQRLRRLVQSGNTEARRLAVRALSKHRDFDNVPALIYALGDKDHVVVREARDALRFVSRRFDGFGMPDFPDREQQVEGIQNWKDWYRSIRPDAKFLE